MIAKYIWHTLEKYSNLLFSAIIRNYLEHHETKILFCHTDDIDRFFWSLKTTNCSITKQLP